MNLKKINKLFGNIKIQYLTDYFVTAVVVYLLNCVREKTGAQNIVKEIKQYQNVECICVVECILCC